jgi:hypothetical protein
MRDACAPHSSFEAQVEKWKADEVDEIVAEADMVMGVHRIAEHWAKHPQGQYLAGQPVIEIVKIGDSEPIPCTPNPMQPLSGIKAVSCSHVIASTP